MYSSILKFSEGKDPLILQELADQEDIEQEGENESNPGIEMDGIWERGTYCLVRLIIYHICCKPLFVIQPGPELEKLAGPERRKYKSILF